MENKNSLLTKTREKLGLTQKQAAQKMGINTQTYGRIERMQHHPSYKTQQRICSFYGLSPDEAFPEELKNTRPDEKNYSQSFLVSRLIPSANIDQDQLTYTHVEENLAKGDLKRKMAEALNTLTPRETEVINLYFGFTKEGELTLEEIGARFGVTKEAISMTKNKAIRRLRHASRSRPLREFLGS